VLRIVGIGNDPVPVDRAEIEAIQRAIHAGLDISPHPYLRTGQFVRINGGALEGSEGRIVDIRRRHRVILSISLLQRSVAVEIDDAWVTPIASPATLFHRHNHSIGTASPSKSLVHP
jgi:transcription antitermination factor NusG